MKNKLLALMVLCGAASPTAPLWAAWDDPALTYATPNLEAIQNGSPEVYYVYHVATGKFMSNGADYNTSLIVSENGQEVTLSYGNDYELITKDPSSSEYSEALGFRMSMMNGPSSNFHEIFIDAAYRCYVDHNEQGHILWEIMPQADGTYRIRVNVDDPIYGANSQYGATLMGVNSNTEGVFDQIVNPLIVEGAGGYEGAAFDWKFVTPEVYEVFRAKQSLQEQLNLADERGFTEYSEYAAIYNKVDATPEEVNKAVEDLKAALVDYSYTVASESNPMDVTSKIVNPSFLNASGGATSDGWATWRETTNDNFQAQASRYSEFQTPDGHAFGDFFERWVSSGSHGDWYVEQALEGLPDGKYRLGAYIMTNNTEANGGASGLFLYANTLGGESTVEANQPSPDGSSWAFPYSVDFNVIGGMVTVGMRADDYAGNWSAVGYFTLQYMGAGEATDMREAVRTNIANMEQKYTDEMANERYGVAEDEAFQAVLATAKEAVEDATVTNDSLTNIVVALQDSYNTLKSSAAQYATLISRIEGLWDLLDNNEAYSELEVPEFEDYVGSLEEAYNAGTFDMAELDSIQPRGEKLWNECIMGALESGKISDVSGMVSATGWTKTGDAGYEENYQIGELWNGRNWEVYQEITGLPEGSYKITAQAFYNPSSTNSNSWHENYGMAGDETNNIRGYLFGNDASVPLVHIMSCPIAENPGNAGNFEEITWGGESQMGMFIPWDHASSEYVFGLDPNNYLNEVTCYVGADGVLRLGTKMSGVEWDAAWVVYDNFKVTYLGADDMSGASTALNALIQEATGVLNAEQLTTQETHDALAKAIEDATAAAGRTLTPETYAEQVAALREAMDAEQAAVDAAAALETKTEGHDQKLYGEYAEYEGTPGCNEMSDLVGQIYDKMDTYAMFASMAGIDEYSLALDKAYSKMVSASLDFSTASKDEPVDVTKLIINPSFQNDVQNEDGTVTQSQSANGWTIEGGGGATRGLNFEVYNDSTDIHQTLYNMPAGYYRVVFNGFYRAGDVTPAALARRDSVGGMPLNAEVYVKSGVNEWREKVPSIFESVREFTKYGSDVFVADTLLPDMADMVYRVIVNDVGGADVAFKKGEYEAGFSFQVAEGEDPVLGMRKMVKVQNDWTCFDNFRLYYLGDGDANRPDDLGDSIEDVAADATVVGSTWTTLNGMKVAEPKQRGIYIRIDKMSDGTSRAVKVLVK